MATKTKKKKDKKQKTKILISISAIFLAIVIAITAISISSNKPDNPLSDIGKDVACGIDVSYHNGRINWHKVAEEYDFAIIRVGYTGYSNGALMEDTSARRNMRKATRADMPIGVYYYSQAITTEEAENEAKMALDIIKGKNITLPIFIDYEYAYEKDGKLGGRLYDADLNKKEATEIINAFCKTIKKAGYTPGVYASTSFYKSVLDAKSITKNAVIWVADYNDDITYNGKYDIWQYTNKGKVSGIHSKHTDKNYWYIK